MPEMAVNRFDHLGTTMITKLIHIKGVSYDRKMGGACCPKCGIDKASVKNVLPWDGNTRIRYHACQACKHKFKSIEEV